MPINLIKSNFQKKKSFNFWDFWTVQQFKIKVLKSIKIEDFKILKKGNQKLSSYNFPLFNGL